MGKGLRQGVILLLLVLVTFIYLNATRIFNPNGLNAHLSNLTYFGVGNQWSSALFGDHKRWSSMQHYVSLRNEYEHQSNYGLFDHHTESRYMGRFSDLAASAFADWQSYQLKTAGKWLTQEADEYFGLESLKQSKSPVLLVGVIAAAYMGKTLRYRFDDQNQVETKTTVTDSKFNEQYLGFRSTAIDVSAGASYGVDGPTLNLRKFITKEVSVNYDHSRDRAVGVSYSAGF